MTSENDTVQEHESIKELSALAVAGNLTEAEWAELKAHLAECASCRSVYEEDLLVAKRRMAILGNDSTAAGAGNGLGQFAGAK